MFDFWGYGQEVVFVMMILVLILHGQRGKQKQHWVQSAFYLYFVGNIFAAGIIGYVILVAGDRPDFKAVALSVFLFGASVFVLLGESMYAGFGRWLTSRLDSANWVKEIDYIYLLLGAGGILISVNRLQIVQDRVSSLDLYGPMVLAFAVALRLIKTRVEINKWQEVPKATGTATGTAAPAQ